MFTRQRRNYKIFVYTALIIALCALVVALFWPKGTETGEGMDNETGTEIDNRESIEEKEATADGRDSVTKGEKETHEQVVGADSEDTEEKPVVGSQIESYYLVKKSGNSIKVFFSNNYGDLIELEETQIVYDVLPPDDQKAFEEGIKVSSQEELSLLLQDFES